MLTENECEVEGTSQTLFSIDSNRLIYTQPKARTFERNNTEVVKRILDYKGGGHVRGPVIRGLTCPCNASDFFYSAMVDMLKAMGAGFADA